MSFIHLKAVCPGFKCLIFYFNSFLMMTLCVITYESDIRGFDLDIWVQRRAFRLHSDGGIRVSAADNHRCLTDANWWVSLVFCSQFALQGKLDPGSINWKQLTLYTYKPSEGGDGRISLGTVSWQKNQQHILNKNPFPCCYLRIL